jgi:hypothetical protein|tara:strand:+ start:131 stop:421 length:291 start_codon:yes stop_codon:yes gene_type:complete
VEVVLLDLAFQLHKVVLEVHQFFQQLLLQEAVEVVPESDHLTQDSMGVQAVEQEEMNRIIMEVVILLQYLQLKELMAVHQQVILGMVVAEAVVQPL